MNTSSTRVPDTTAMKINTDQILLRPLIFVTSLRILIPIIYPSMNRHLYHTLAHPFFEAMHFGCSTSFPTNKLAHHFPGTATGHFTHPATAFPFHAIFLVPFLLFLSMRRVVGSGEGKGSGEKDKRFGKGLVLRSWTWGHLVRNRGPDAFFDMGLGGVSPRAEDRLCFLSVSI